MHVVVVGGGYGGIHAAKALDPYCRVTLISRADSYFVSSLSRTQIAEPSVQVRERYTTRSAAAYRVPRAPSSPPQLNIAAPRAIVEGAPFAVRAAIPYTNLLQHGTYLQAEVLSVGSSSVVVKAAGATTRDTIAFDYCIVATGSTYPAPIKPSSPAVVDTIAALDGLRIAVSKASSVVIIGGGPVGCEIAGEVKTAFPKASVTLLHSGAALLSGRRNMAGGAPHNPALATRVTAKLASIGVRVVLNERVPTLPEGLRDGTSAAVTDGPTTVVGASGASYVGDVVIRASGGAPSSAPIGAGELASTLDEAGFVKVCGVDGCDGDDGDDAPC